MNPETPTPRTDSALDIDADYGHLIPPHYLKECSRKLERELTAAQTALAASEEKLRLQKEQQRVGDDAFNHLQERFNTSEARVRELEDEKKKILVAEHALSSAYLRIRTMLGAFNAPFAPTLAQISEHTESKLNLLLEDADKLRAQLLASEASRLRMREALELFRTACQGSDNPMELIAKIAACAGNAQLALTTPAPAVVTLEEHRKAVEVARKEGDRKGWGVKPANVEWSSIYERQIPESVDDSIHNAWLASSAHAALEGKKDK